MLFKYSHFILIGGNGFYKENQIMDLFTTAYTSFKAAVLESQKDLTEKSKVIIHTGNW